MYSDGMSIHPSRILFEDEHLLIINKLARELTVAGKGKSDTLSLLDFLKKQYPGLKPVNRLDFETSGIVVFAKQSYVAQKIIVDDFAQFQKKYVTLVIGHPPKLKNVIKKPLPARTKGLVEAETRFTILDTFANSTYVEVQMLTGRHHQIRLHFASIGHPLVLDQVYGHKKYNGIFTQEFKVRDFFLHASELQFTHPVLQTPLHIVAPLPAPFASVLKKLRALSK